MDQDPYLKIHIVEVYVRDQDKSLAFYRDRSDGGGHWSAGIRAMACRRSAGL